MTRLWFRRFGGWLAEPRLLWLGLLVIVVALVEVIFGPESLEPRIRVTGGLLQVAGILTVAYGIREVRRLFGKRGLVELAIDWLSRIPLKALPNQGNALVATESATASAEARVTEVVGPNAKLEERVRALETNLKDLDRRYDQTRGDLKQDVLDRKSAFDAERSARSAEDAVTRITLKAAQTGGLNISVMGAVWLTVGVMVSATSIEIADVLTLFSLLI